VKLARVAGHSFNKLSFLLIKPSNFPANFFGKLLQ